MHLPTLLDVASGVIIVAHKENTVQLADALTSEGFEVEEVRGPYDARQSEFSATMRCFINHRNAWLIAASRQKPTVIVEADFVPVLGFGRLIAPVPAGKKDFSIAYLYSVAPQMWDVATENAVRGHAGGLVATLVPPRTASLLLEFFDEVLASNPSGEYVPFDAQLGYWLLERGCDSYIPYRQFGEHGGLTNPEHQAHGLGRAHRADALQARLAFLPIYASGSKTVFFFVRVRARLWGWARLCTGRTISIADIFRTDIKATIRFVFGRLCTPALPR